MRGNASRLFLSFQSHFNVQPSRMCIYISTMGLLKQAIFLACLATLARSSTEPMRPTRTLGSLFGSKPVPQAPQPEKPQPQQQATRPLVYQVKYYDKQVHHPETLHPDARNYGTIDKSGISLDPVQQNQLVYNPGYTVPRNYYYNPLIPEQPQVYYTVAQIGNSQVLIPCTDNLQQQDSTIALNVEQQPQQVQQLQQIQQPRPVTQKQVRVVPPTAIQQPLVREQVVQAASDLQYHGSLPGSGVVGAGLNQAPYGYYYYYYIPENTRAQPPVNPVLPPQVVPQVQVPQVNPYVNQQLLYRLNNYNPYVQSPYAQNSYPYVPVIVSGVPVGLNQQVLPHNQVFQNQVLRVDGKDRQVMQATQPKPVVAKETQ